MSSQNTCALRSLIRLLAIFLQIIFLLAERRLGDRTVTNNDASDVYRVHNASYDPTFCYPQLRGKSFLSNGAWPTTLHDSYGSSSSGYSLFESGRPTAPNALPSTGFIGKLRAAKKTVYEFFLQEFMLSHFKIDHTFNPLILGGPIALLYSETNAYLWGSSFTSVFKLKRDGPRLRLASHHFRRHVPNDLQQQNIFHGAYSVLSKEVWGLSAWAKQRAIYNVVCFSGFQNIFYTTSGRSIDAYGDDDDNPDNMRYFGSVDIGDERNWVSTTSSYDAFASLTQRLPLLPTGTHKKHSATLQTSSLRKKICFSRMYVLFHCS